MKPYNLSDQQSHPLAMRFYNLARELERLPASPEQTALMIQLDEIKRTAQALLNDDPPLTDVQRSVLNGTFGVRSATAAEREAAGS